MKIAIFQINFERDKYQVMFMSFEQMRHTTGSNMVQSKIYDKVFEGDVDCASLEDVFNTFNLNHPDEYAGRSLSVSDIVWIGNENTFYFCDNFGWKEVEFDPTKTGWLHES